MTDSVFLVDAYGEFSRSQLQIVWRDEHRPPHAELDALVADTWSRLRAECDSKGVCLFNGQLARYLRHYVEDGILVIEVGPSDYANFMCTNYINGHLVDKYGWGMFGNALGTSATLITSDGWCVYGRRSMRVACHSGYVHTFGGCIEPGERSEEGIFDGYSCILRELTEELGLGQRDIKELLCLGIIRDSTILQPELIFDARVDLTRDDIAGRIEPDGPNEEHDGIVVCRDERQLIVPFIKSTELIAPVAVGALCLHGRRSFGERWYRRIMRELGD